jgi:hypothetical protein
MQLAKKAFAEPTTLTDAEVAEILTKGPDFKTWLSSIQEYALAQAKAGLKTWPGFKLVEGKSNRVITNTPKVLATLNKAKIDPALFLSSPELLGIGALEKNLGKESFNKLLGGYVLKPAGSPTLVPDWDKRPKINGVEAAKEAFKDLP